MTTPEKPDASDLESRLERLNAKIEKSRIASKPEQKTIADADKTGIAQAFRLSSEFIAAIGVGAFLGWAIDTFFDTLPFGLIAFLMLGFAAGILNVLRAVGKVAESPLRRHNDADPQDG